MQLSMLTKFINVLTIYLVKIPLLLKVKDVFAHVCFNSVSLNYELGN